MKESIIKALKANDGMFSPKKLKKCVKNDLEEQNEEFTEETYEKNIEKLIKKGKIEIDGKNFILVKKRKITDESHETNGADEVEETTKTNKDKVDKKSKQGMHVYHFVLLFSPFYFFN